MRQLLRDEELKATKVLLMGITNHPTCIELSVKRNFAVPLYFEPTPLDVIKMIIQEELGSKIEKIGEIAEKYIDSFRRLKMRPMGAEVTAACRISKESHPNLNTLPSCDIVTILKGNTPVTPTEAEIKALEKQNENLIDLSEKNVMPHWLNLYKNPKEQD